MNEPQILSSESDFAQLRDSTTPQTTSALPAFIFDACHLGVVLRAVLGVEITLMVAALYQSTSVQNWLFQTAWLTSGGLPGTLLWLIMACSLKRVLHKLESYWQYSIGILLGCVAGLYATVMFSLTAQIGHLHWFANAITGALMAAVLVGYLILRTEGKTPAATKAQLIALQAHIRPHFLFNTLNSAISLVRDEPRKAEILLEDLSDLFRATMQDPRSSVPLLQEIELAKRYLSIEQIRFGNRLKVIWDLDPATFHVCLPPLLLQPLLENAVKHGVELHDQETKVTIVTRLIKNEVFFLSVTNTLYDSHNAEKKHPTNKGLGVALANVKRRLFLLHDVQATFSAKAKDGKFEVCISIPAI